MPVKFSRMLVVRDQASKVLGLGEEAFDLPSATIPKHRASVLSEVATAAMRANYFNPSLGQFSVELIGVVGVVANQSPDRLGDSGRGDLALLPLPTSAPEHRDQQNRTQQ